MRRMMVMGMGITGRAVTTALQRRDIDVIALDDRISDDLLSWTADHGVSVHAPATVDIAALLRGVDGVLPAPGVPDHHPIFGAAAEAGVPVMSEFDLAAGWDDRPVVAVTGTDGKTTVVTLIERMLEHSGIAARAVGNTDTPWVEAIDDPTTDVFVVEASSFRLGHSQHFSPAVGTWLNFGPDHLDAHRDLAAYETAKAAIWRELQPGALAVANRDDPVVARHANTLVAGDTETFGAGAPTTAVDHGVVDGVLVSGTHELVAIDELGRAMPHDILNGLAASATAMRVGAASPGWSIGWSSSPKSTASATSMTPRQPHPMQQPQRWADLTRSCYSLAGRTRASRSTTCWPTLIASPMLSLSAMRQPTLNPHLRAERLSPLLLLCTRQSHKQPRPHRPVMWFCCRQPAHLLTGIARMPIGAKTSPGSFGPDSLKARHHDGNPQ